MKIRLTATLLFFVSSSAFAQETQIQWGANRGVSPWQVGVLDSTRTLQPLFTVPASGGGISLVSGLTIPGFLSTDTIHSTPPAADRAFYAAQTNTGTVVGVGSAFAFQGQPSWLYNAIEAVDETTLTGGGLGYTAAFSVGLYTGGTTSTGTKAAVEIQLNHAVASNPATPRDHIALNVDGVGSVSDGGTTTSGPLSGSKGDLFGIAVQGHALSGSVNTIEVTGAELDAAIESGGSSYARHGVSAVSEGSVAGAVIDAAYDIGATSIGWQNALMLSSWHGSNPLTTTGCVICTDGSSAVITTGFSLKSYTITGNFAECPSLSCVITGAGAATFTALTANNNATFNNQITLNGPSGAGAQISAFNHDFSSGTTGSGFIIAEAAASGNVNTKITSFTNGNAALGIVEFTNKIQVDTSAVIGAGSAITSSGPGGALTAPAFQAGGLSTTCTVTVGNTLTFTNGILTAKGANCT